MDSPSIIHLASRISSRMASLVQLFVIAAALATAYGQNLNVTSSARDYLLISQRELLHDIDIVNVEIAAVDARFADRLDTIQFQQQQTLQEIKNVNRTLMPLQALSVVRKHCIQKYDSQLVTYDNAQLRMKSCYDKAALTANSLTSSPKSNSVYATSAVVTSLPNSASSCDYSYSKNQTALEICYVNAVDNAKTNVNYYLDTSRTQLEKSLYDANIAARTAVTCSFVVEKETLEKMGSTTKLIDDCEVSLKKQSTVAVLAGPETKSVQSLILGKISGQ